MGNKILTPEFRGNFVHVVKPHAFDGGEPEYSITVALPKKDRETKDFIADLEDAFMAAMDAKMGKAIPFEKCKDYPIKDGDNQTGDKEYPELLGCWYFRAKNDRQPGIMVMDEDGTRHPFERENEIYSGAWYYATVSPYAWSNKFGKGVSISLSGVLKSRDDDAIGGNSFSENEFDNVPGGKRGGREERRPSRNEDDRPSRGRGEDDRPSRRDDREERRPSRDREERRPRRDGNDF